MMYGRFWYSLSVLLELLNVGEIMTVKSPENASVCEKYCKEHQRTVVEERAFVVSSLHVVIRVCNQICTILINHLSSTYDGT